MATRNVLGKIAAVVSINTGSVRPTLNSTAKDVERFATTVRSRISSATRASGKAFDDIFTPLQKLQAALKAANQQPVDLKIQNGREILQAVRAAEQIAKPLANARKEFGTLSQGVQASLLPVLQSAQKQATNLFDALSNGAKVSNTDLANTEARVQQLISAFSRAAQASQLIRGLGNGTELQFQNPEFVEQARRSAQLQQQASSLTASQLSGSSIVNLIGQQRAAADEAERLRAALDKVRTTRNGDAAAAQAAYSNQLALLASINDRIERQVALIQRAAAAEQSAASARSAAQQQVTNQRNSLASASAALTGGITPQVQDVNEVFSNLTSRAQQARAAVANAFRTPEAADLRNRLAQIAAEVGNIQDEYRTLSAQDPQRREILRWQDLEERVQAVNFRLGAVTSLANQAREALGGVADEFTESQLQAQRLAAANERLVVDQQESQVLSNEGASSRRATPVPRSVFEEGFARQIRNELGPAITDQQRQFDVLRGSIVSVKGQLDTLPAGIRSQFIPAIQQAEAEFQRLRALGPDATAEAIENAGNEVDRLGQQLRRVSQVQAIPNFADSLNETSLRGALGNLNALQQILSRVGATAGSELGQAFDRMRAIVQRATRDGTLGTQAFQRELRQAAREAANLAAQTGRISASRAFREIQRGGDIARGGFDRLSLATQQAAFALDDFFSVQGDFSQRIRAVQNNVTQLAFILGGTPALFVAIGTAIAAQAAVGLVRWYNEGRTAEDQTRALNDALGRQKSLVDELAQAFDSLGDSIAGRAFSRSGEEARQFQRELAAIDRQQRELREARLVDNDAAVGVQRANQNRIRRQLDDETDVGRRIVLQRQLDESQRIERRLANERLAQPAPDGAAVRQAIQDLAAGFAAASSNRRTAAGLFGTFAQDTLSAAGAATAALPANLRNQLAGTNFGNTTAAIESQIRALDAAIGFLAPIAEERTFLGTNTFGGGQAQEAIQSFTNIINALRNVRLDKELDDAARRIFEVGNLSARRIEESQNSVAEAIEAGVPGARAVERRLNSLGNQLQQAFDDLKEARTADPDQRTSLQANAQARIDRIRRQQVAELAAADSLRRENTLNPERQIGSVISRIESEISSIGSPAAGIQGRLRELQFERESIRQQRAGIGNNPFAARRLDAAEQALTLAIRSLEDEVNVLSESFNSFNREVDNRLNPQGDAVRGLDSFETPGERAARELQQGLANIAAAADALEERILSGIAPGGVPLRGATDEERGRFAEIERRQQQAEQQLIAEQQRAAAPAIFGLADPVENAVLQGPSRAALNVSDISTQEGARELNRLLRGEDSNRDNQNLVELQRQSTILEEMLRDLKNGVNNVAAAR